MKYCGGLKEKMVLNFQTILFGCPLQLGRPCFKILLSKQNNTMRLMFECSHLALRAEAMKSECCKINDEILAALRG